MPRGSPDGGGRGAEIAGIRFVVKPNAEAYDLEIPELNCVYTHMMGHDCHSIVAGCSHADEMRQKVQAQYPHYSGLNYLDMTVGFFFPGK